MTGLAESTRGPPRGRIVPKRVSKWRIPPRRVIGRWTNASFRRGRPPARFRPLIVGWARGISGGFGPPGGVPPRPVVVGASSWFHLPSVRGEIGFPKAGNWVFLWLGPSCFLAVVDGGPLWQRPSNNPASGPKTRKRPPTPKETDHTGWGASERGRRGKHGGHAETGPSESRHCHRGSEIRSQGRSPHRGRSWKTPQRRAGSCLKAPSNLV